MNKICLLGASLCVALAFTSCKPKQSAYKAAYEAAKEKETTAPVQEEVVYEEESEPVAPVSKPRSEGRIGYDSYGEHHRRSPEKMPTALKRYSVVVGSFRNKTNAYSLKERMIEAGYDAVLGENEQGMLRVIVSSFDNKADAIESREAIKAK